MSRHHYKDVWDDVEVPVRGPGEAWAERGRGGKGKQQGHWSGDDEVDEHGGSAFKKHQPPHPIFLNLQFASGFTLPFAAGHCQSKMIAYGFHRGAVSPPLGVPGYPPLPSCSLLEGMLLVESCREMEMEIEW